MGASKNGRTNLKYFTGLFVLQGKNTGKLEYTLENNAEEQNNNLAEVFKREQSRLLKFIRSRIGIEADAEDILQDVFYQFISSMRMEPIEKAASWLFHTAGNKIIDWYRKIKPASLDSLNESSAEDNDEPALRLEDKLNLQGDSDKHFLRSVVWEMLEEALEELPDKQREVFLMNEIERKSFREISEITGEPVNTLISRKRYAVLFLRERFRELYDDLFDN